MNQSTPHLNDSQPGHVASSPSSAESASSNAGRRALVGVRLIVAILAAAYACHVLIPATPSYFQIPAEIAARTEAVRGPSLPPDLQADVDAAWVTIERQNGGLGLAIVGTLVVGCLTLAAGFSYNLATTAIAGGLGIVLGAILGGAAGYAGTVFDQLTEVRVTSSMFAQTAIHAFEWAMLGIALAGALRISRVYRGNWLRLVMTLAVATIAANLAFLLIGGFLFTDRSNIAIPEGKTNRSAWIALNSLVLALTLYRLSGTSASTIPDSNRESS